MKTLCCCILLLSQGVLVLGVALPEQTVESQPDLTLLEERVTRLWMLITERKKADALEYVDPPSRNAFVNRREARILSFTVEDIEVGADPTQVQVTVRTEIRSNISSSSVTVPIQERWVYNQGAWLVQIHEPDARDLFRRSRTKSPVVEPSQSVQD